MMTRQPIVSGMFYEDTQKSLNRQIEECFEKGPGMPGKRSQKKTLGIIAPHAGYAYSGICQAYAYKEIAESKMPDVFIILGTNHTGLGNTATLTEDWKTPLGTVKCHKKFVNYLTNNSILEDRPMAHQEEHSIEVQLPFLQFACKDKQSKIRIVPISVSHDCPHKDLAFSLTKALKKTKYDAALIASSDFTHYGPNYGYIPFNKDIKEHLYNLDREAISFINKLDDKNFLKYVKDKQATICGSKAIAALLATAKRIGAEKAKLLNYYTSGDITKDYKNAVGYASLKII